MPLVTLLATLASASADSTDAPAPGEPLPFSLTTTPSAAILVFFFSKLGKVSLAYKEYIYHLSSHLRKMGSFSEQIRSPSCWIILGLVLSMAVMLFRGIRWKRFSISFMLTGILFGGLRSYGPDVHRAFSALAKIFPALGNNSIVRTLLGNEDLPLLVLSLTISCILAGLYRILVYLPLAVILFEARAHIHKLFKTLPDGSLLVSAIILLILVILVRKLIFSVLDLIMGAIFAMNGSMGLLALSEMINGHPKGFCEFGESIDVTKLSGIGFSWNLVIWVGLSSLGFLNQTELFSSKGSKK